MSDLDVRRGQYLMSITSQDLPHKQQLRQLGLYLESPMMEIVMINRK